MREQSLKWLYYSQGEREREGERDEDLCEREREGERLESKKLN